MEHGTFERELSEGYKEVLHIDAKDRKTGLILNAGALLISVFVFAVAAILIIAIMPRSFFSGDEAMPVDAWFPAFAKGMLIGFLSFAVYIVLHELTHGAVYKKLTGEKLTFGITWSAAFCGVPNIYVKRKTAVTACIAPFALFSVLFIPFGIVCLVLTAVYESIFAFTLFIAVTFVFALHLGGCVGDLYVIYLMTVKYKSKDTLMRDTGPEQFFYIREEI